jgi:hypothetical protein
MTASTAKRYRAYGLNIVSDIELPCAERGQGPSNVVFGHGSVAERLHGSLREQGCFQASEHEVLLSVPRVGRFLVVGGREVTVDRAPGASDDDIRTHLLTSALGALLHQRCELPIHASAIATEAGAVLFAGPSGAGKSTLASALLEHGFSMLADDIVSVRVAASGSHANSAFPCARLWRDALLQLGQPVQSLRAVRRGLEKYVVPIERFAEGSLRVRRIYLLGAHNRPETEYSLLRGVEAFDALYRSVYRRNFVVGAVPTTKVFSAVHSLCGATEVIRLHRSLHPRPIAALAEEVAAQIG